VYTDERGDCRTDLAERPTHRFVETSEKIDFFSGYKLKKFELFEKTTFSSKNGPFGRKN
jgi:ATP-dependent RNA circularization protein (DNA/RNA ligase family)